MAEQRILIAEDDESTSVTLKGFLSARGYIVETAKDGSEALRKFNINPAQVVITDLEMPVMSGNELIQHLSNLEIPPVIFVTTGHKDTGLIVDLMTKGVYDYILKPVDMSDLLLKLKRAFEAYEMKRAFEISEREKAIRLENSVEWFKFEEKISSRDLKSMSANIFESLLTSFNQGSGFGSLITLMALMKSTAIKEGEYYKIRDNLFDMIMGSVTSAEKALQTFADMTKIVSGRRVSEKISLENLHDKIYNKIVELDSKAALRKHHLMLSDTKTHFRDLYINVNINYLMKAVEEIVINAMKFSPPGSDVMILFVVTNNRFSISVINDVSNNDKEHKGIPIGYENLVFEPFFRITKTVNEEYETLDYGLGLTLAEKIITNDGGAIAINNISDYSDIKGGAKTKVECSVTFTVSK